MTGVAQKADYVRSELRKGHDGKHHCHWPGCEKRVAPAVWGCRPHWYTLPQGLRNKIWAAFREGQEVSKTPSRRYIEVAREVQQWIKENHGEQQSLL